MAGLSRESGGERLGTTPPCKRPGRTSCRDVRSRRGESKGRFRNGVSRCVSTFCELVGGGQVDSG